MSIRTASEVADAVFDAIERGDTESLASLWADDIGVWHNHDQIVQSKDENLAVLAWMIRNTTSVEYRDIARDLTSDGFAQRHTLRITHLDGRTTDLPAALFATVRDGQVTAIYEYLDSAQVTAAFGGRS